MKGIVSVVMPSLNSGIFIEEAIISCIEQKELLELIIMDGGSKKKTLSIIKKYALNDKRIKFYIEEDRGPADAINKAIKLAKGKYIGWLNSDDKYEKNSLKRSLDSFDKNKNLKMIYGHGKHIDESGSFLNFYPSLKPEVGIDKFQDGCYICQPTVIFKKELFNEVGYLNEKLKTCFDFEFWLRIFKKDSKNEIGFLNNIQAYTRLHKNSITTTKVWESNIESSIILSKYLGFTSDHWITQAVRSIILKDKEEAINYLENSYLNKLLNRNLRSIYTKNLDRFLYELNQLNSEYIENRNDLPNVIKLLLKERFDLQEHKFHYNDRNLCIWLYKHATKEYPYLFEGNSLNNNLIKWLSESKDNSIPRIIQAIWDQNKGLRRLFLFKRFKFLLIIFIKINWRKYVDSDVIKFNDFFVPFYKKLDLKKLNFKKNNDFNLVELVGYINYPSGIGEDIRTTFNALKFKGINAKLVNYELNKIKRTENFILNQNISKSNESKIIILCLNPINCLWYLSNKSKIFSRSKYIIAYLPWELYAFPSKLKSLFKYIDEIWTPSEFIFNALDEFKKIKKLMPLCVEYPDKTLKEINYKNKKILRNKFKIPSNKLVFLCSFDLESYVERKNPWAAINAFQMAFEPHIKSINKEVFLIIKTFKPLSKNRDWEMIKELTLIDDRIKIIEEDLSQKDLLSLYSCCDVLISLHRSEGFGRIIAECIQLGLEIVTTNWGGNTDFCDPNITHLVKYKFKDIIPGTYPYWPNQKWADPDLYQAADIFKQIYYGKRLNNNQNKRKKTIYNFSLEKCGTRYKERLEQISLKLSNN